MRLKHAKSGEECQSPRKRCVLGLLQIKTGLVASQEYASARENRLPRRRASEDMPVFRVSFAANAPSSRVIIRARTKKICEVESTARKR